MYPESSFVDDQICVLAEILAQTDEQQCLTPGLRVEIEDWISMLKLRRNELTSRAGAG